MTVEGDVSRSRPMVEGAQSTFCIALCAHSVWGGVQVTIPPMCTGGIPAGVHSVVEGCIPMPPMCTLVMAPQKQLLTLCFRHYARTASIESVKIFSLQKGVWPRANWGTEFCAFKLFWRVGRIPEPLFLAGSPLVIDQASLGRRVRLELIQTVAPISVKYWFTLV